MNPASTHLNSKGVDSHITTIEPPTIWLSLNLWEVWRYRDLLLLMVYRDFVSLYKQTILGPIWFLLQPMMTTLVFTLIFQNIARVSTDGLPGVLFYLAGVTCWTYFSETLTKTSETFSSNANIFGKVYFPRIIVPLSIVVSGLLKFAVQLCLFLCVLVYYYLHDANVFLNWTIILFPLLVALMAMIGLGFGMIISAMTTKYRDLRFLLQFAIQLAMYGTPVIYPSSTIPEQYKWIIAANPLTPIFETFRHGFLGVGEYNITQLAYSAVFSICLFLLGTVIFNRAERTFMDTV
jgi:lipopolysaccharide transport system permease protein